jgi:hypothetical protein
MREVEEADSRLRKEVAEFVIAQHLEHYNAQKKGSTFSSWLVHPSNRVDVRVLCTDANNPWRDELRRACEVTGVLVARDRSPHKQDKYDVSILIKYFTSWFQRSHDPDLKQIVATLRGPSLIGFEAASSGI